MTALNRFAYHYYLVSSTESVTEEAIHRYYGNNTVLASLKITSDGVTEEKQFKLADFPVHEKLEKFMEDVKFGIYPLTAFAMATPVPAIERPPSPESQQADLASEEQQQDVENRRIQNMQCSIQESEDKKEKVGDVGQLSLRILLRFEVGSVVSRQNAKKRQNANLTK